MVYKSEVIYSNQASTSTTKQVEFKPFTGQVTIKEVDYYFDNGELVGAAGTPVKDFPYKTYVNDEGIKYIDVDGIKTLLESFNLQKYINPNPDRVVDKSIDAKKEDIKINTKDGPKTIREIKTLKDTLVNGNAPDLSDEAELLQKNRYPNEPTVFDKYGAYIIGGLGGLLAYSYFKGKRDAPIVQQVQPAPEAKRGLTERDKQVIEDIIAAENQ